ncbi:MAG TPA: FAD:protein FMN transferase [Hyphomicrobiaceae bacterium]|nr:FAD:protein FMN transferase [Hyphomicrobiaceae bacterium]
MNDADPVEAATRIPARRVIVPEIAANGALRPLPGRDKLVQVGGETMGTTWSAKLYAPSTTDGHRARQAIQDALDHVVSEMSPWVATSALSRFNEAPAGSWHTLPLNFFAVLRTALSIARESKGAFDPTLGALTDAWGFGPSPARSHPPDARDTARMLAHAGWQRLDLDEERRRVRQPGGLAIDLGGIAKGFGVDQAARALKRLGIRDFLVEVGGELRGEGIKPDGTPWWVALEQPPATSGGEATLSDIVIALHGLSVATSGDYRRFVEHDGIRHAHSIDPRTGRPVGNGVAIVTVLHESCMWADALATALLVMGRAAAIAFAVEHRIAARMLMRTEQGMSEVLTPRFADLLRDEGEAA